MNDLETKNQLAPRSNNRLLITSAAILTVLFIEFVFSILIQQRAQHQLLSDFEKILSQAATAVGQTSVSPLPDTAAAYGSPVALIQIPKLNVTQVVVEGSTSNFTQAGPGHVPGTALPGQAGEAVIIGRRTSFGAPFFKIGELKTGDIIKVTTVEGPANYKVIDPKESQASSGLNTLKLVTANPPILATGSLSVVAQLQAKPYPDTPKNSRIPPASNQFALMLLILQILAVLLYFTRGIYRKFGALVGWMLLTPLLAATFLALTLTFDTLLPATL